MSGYSVRLLSANIDASGVLQGGLVRIGGAFQGGKHNPDTQAYDQFVTRWQESAEIANAQRLFVNDSTQVNVSSAFGAGGTAIFWSNVETTLLAHINANGATQGGTVEISSADTLRRLGLGGIIGADTILLDPKNIIIGDSTSLRSWTHSALLGAGYSAGSNVNVVGLNGYDYFGTSVALNAAGNLLAVGSYGDDGAGNIASGSGAVRLFSFTDGNFSGGTLQATVGKGYVGGNNIDVASLESNDYFGASISLNATGDRLAVGAIGDDGAGNLATDSGAVHVFSFSAGNFSGGSQQAIIGKGYVGGKNVDVSGLELSDSFASAVALNAAGDRLAIGAYRDDGAGNTANDSGAVYLYRFTDDNFSSGSLQAIVGKGYSGGNNVDVAGLESLDGFGISAAFNASGDRLAVGAYGDDGVGNTASDSGAAYLYSFADNNFSSSSLQAKIGKGYVGANNLNVANLEAGDAFGRALALNAAGDLLAAGAFSDDGAGNLASDSGAVYLFGFADSLFSSASLQSIIGKGYSGFGDIDLSTLEIGDALGISVALNSAGDRLAVGAILDDGTGNAALDRGAVHLFSLVPDPLTSTINFADYPDQTITILTTDLESILNAGTDVLLQASNDITFASAVAVNNTNGDGGNIALQAGRNINFNANLTTDNGNLTAVAGDPAAIASERNPGIATISLGNNVVLDMGAGIATLAAVGGNFINNSSTSMPIVASQIALYSTDPSLNVLGGMTAAGKRYNQPYVAGTTPANATNGNWLFYSVAPVLSVTPNQQLVNYGSQLSPFTITYSGFIDGDDVATSGIQGVASFAGEGKSPGIYNIDYVGGLLSSMGYMFVNNAASHGELVVKAPVRVPDDVIANVQKRYLAMVVNREPLQGGCGEDSLIASSTISVMERFANSEGDACSLDFLSDKSMDDGDNSKNEKGKCRTDDSE